MPVVVRFEPPAHVRWAPLLFIVSLLTGLVPLGATRALDAGIEHLVVSEIVTGGTSASDELIELYNPAATTLPLEGLELVYVTATGTTISRRAAWVAGAPPVPPGGHVLVANEAGVYASIADAVYASGMAATGGSVALRILGAASAIDAVGWGTAASAWLEGTNAPAPADGASIERRPGGALGSTQDTDDNATDFAERVLPEPQNLGSPPTPEPGASPALPTSTPTPTATIEATTSSAPSSSATATPAMTEGAVSTPGPTPDATPISIATARSSPDDALVTVEGTAIAGSDFHDGGGWLADSSGGIAVLLESGSFARGDLLRVTGTIDDRFSQRTIRATSTTLLGTGVEPEPLPVRTGSVNEMVEGRLVRISGTLVGSRTVLSTGIAVDLDDGSGAARVIVPTAAGIEISAWTAGATIDLVAIAGQRDSTGSGTEGYRVMLRGPRDVLHLAASGSPTPTPSSSPTLEPTPAPSQPGDADRVASIAEARAAVRSARVRIRGVVTLPTGIVDQQTSVIQDPSGAIVLRLGDEAGSLAAGQRIEVVGIRSTKSGMETLRVSEAPLQLGTAPAPSPLALRTGDAAEAHEALLVVARGALAASARRASSGTVSFEIDDGSGPLRISLGAVLEADDEPLVAGTWIEVIGVLGQETTGAQPHLGYRVWPRSTPDLRVLASGGDARAVAEGTDVTNGSRAGARSGHSASGSSLDRVGGPDLAGVRIGATLVAGPWPELEIGGVLWDGDRLVAIDAGSSEVVGAIGGRLPVAVELAGLRATGTEPISGAPRVALGTDPGEVMRSERPPVAPRSALPAANEPPAWVSLVGRLENEARRLVIDSTGVAIDYRCREGAAPTAGVVGVTGIATAEPVRLLVPCGGIVTAAALMRSGAGTTLDDSTAIQAPRARRTAADLRPDPRHPLAAALFLLGAVMLAGAAASKRWLEPPPTGVVPAAGAADDKATVAAEHEQAGSLPHVTLLRVPREHGP